MINNGDNKIMMYSFYDKKAERYDTPFFAHSNLFAERHFKMRLQQKESMLAQFKDDFILIKLGEFELVNGQITPLMETVVEGLQIAKLYPEEVDK